MKCPSNFREKKVFHLSNEEEFTEGHKFVIFLLYLRNVLIKQGGEKVEQSAQESTDTADEKEKIGRSIFSRREA